MDGDILAFLFLMEFKALREKERKRGSLGLNVKRRRNTERKRMDEETY